MGKGSSGGLPFCLPGQWGDPAFHGTYNQAVAETFRIPGGVLEGKMELLLLLVDDLHSLPGFSAWGGNTTLRGGLVPAPDVPQQARGSLLRGRLQLLSFPLPHSWACGYPSSFFLLYKCSSSQGAPALPSRTIPHQLSAPRGWPLSLGCSSPGILLAPLDSTPSCFC